MQERVTGLPPMATHGDFIVVMEAVQHFRSEDAYYTAGRLLRVAALIHLGAAENPAEDLVYVRGRAARIALTKIGLKSFVEISADWPEELRRHFL